MKNELNDIGEIIEIEGSVIKVKGLIDAKIGDLIKIGTDELMGEVIKHYGSYILCQSYEFLDGLDLSQKVVNTHKPLTMELGPGLLNSIFDGIQRPLEAMFTDNYFLEPGLSVPSLDRKKKWHFIPTAKIGQMVTEGDIIGTVQETSVIEHKIMIPIGKSGLITEIAKEGKYTVIDEICVIKEGEKSNFINMIQYWPIRKARPYNSYLPYDEPLVTGQRVIDFLFPLAKGGTVFVPGGFGTGKTVVQQNIAKWADADVVVYVGCGERGNELADILESFPKMIDPYKKAPIMEKTILIGNTSNMPVSAREASIFSGLTIAEYYRDMGYNVILLADSTSRWAEALREISSRLEELPAEGGYPAYLSTKLASFYERAGIIMPHGTPNRKGSVSIIASVSPPGGNLSDTVTKTTRRFTKALWALDPKLAYSRFYPAINHLTSYSLYGKYLEKWWNKISRKWMSTRKFVNKVLSQSIELEKLTKLIGFENLTPDNQITIQIADFIKNSFLIQNAFDDVDSFSAPEKTVSLIELIKELYDGFTELIRFGVPIFKLLEISVLSDIKRARYFIKNDEMFKFHKIMFDLHDEISRIKSEYSSIELQNILGENDESSL